MAELSLDKLFLDTLKDIYYAERQILKTMPKMARAIQTPELKDAMTLHREQTQGQIERLQQVFEILGKRASPARRSTAFWKRAPNCWRRRRRPRRRAMPGCWRARRRSSTTRWRATAR